MFGLSLSKLILTAVVIWLAWMVFKRIGNTARGGRPRQHPADRARRAAEQMTRSRTQDMRANDAQTVDLVRCPSCGNFNAPGTTCSCGYKVPK